MYVVRTYVATNYAVIGGLIVDDVCKFQCRYYVNISYSEVFNWQIIDVCTSLRNLTRKGQHLRPSVLPTVWKGKIFDQLLP